MSNVVKVYYPLLDIEPQEYEVARFLPSVSADMDSGALVMELVDKSFVRIGSELVKQAIIVTRCH